MTDLQVLKAMWLGRTLWAYKPYNTIIIAAWLGEERVENHVDPLIVAALELDNLVKRRRCCDYEKQAFEYALTDAGLTALGLPSQSEMTMAVRSDGSVVTARGKRRK